MQLPPYPYLCQLAQHHCPELDIYLRLAREQDEDGFIVYTREYIQDVVCYSFARFVNILRLLTREGLLEYNVLDNEVSIVLAKCDIEE